MKALCQFKLLLSLLFIALMSTAMAQVAPAAKAPARLLFEKAYIHTDRDYYTAGDDIWFKAYLVDAQSNLLNNSSGNLHVELISPQGQVFNNETLNLVNGTAAGDFKLTDSIPAGSYRLRAYTQWQLNFGNSFVFEKNITVYNSPANSKPIVLKDADGKIIKPTISPLIKSGAPAIQFFPEGGSMVQDVAGLVAFKAEDPMGKEVKVRGTIVSSTGDTISHYESVVQGMGSFVFIPEAGKTYTAMGTFNGTQPFKTVLPAALEKGYVLHVSNADSAHLRITISTNAATMADNPDKEVTFMARHTGQRFLNSPIKFVFLQINASVPKNKFPAGISSVTIYDKALKPQCERLIYVPDSNSTQALTINTDKQEYAGKQKVTLSLKTMAGKEPVRANLSVAVVNANTIPASEGNIASYLMLQSELKGPIAHADMYFDADNANRFKQLDLLLMTQGWRDFVWRRLADDGIHLTYPAENGFALNGNLREKFANKPIPHTNVSLIVKGEVLSQEYMTKTDSLGKYSFRNVPVVGNKAITLAAFDDKKKKVGWIKMDSIANNAPPVTALPEYTGDANSESLFLKSAATAMASHPKLSDTVKLHEVQIKGDNYTRLLTQTTTSFGYPEFKYDITSKYYFYNSLSDFLIHEVPGAHINRNDSVVFRGTKFDADKNHESAGDILPRFIVNNREDADDLNNGVFLNLSMDQVNKVIVRHVLGQTVAVANSDGNYRTGTGGDVFLIFLDIKPTAFDKVQFNTLNSHIDGYYQARTFYKPVYDAPGANSTAPDNRTTVYWDPAVFTNGIGEATVSFYNADPKAKMRVIVQGITEKGVPVAGGATYTVK